MEIAHLEESAINARKKLTRQLDNDSRSSFQSKSDWMDTQRKNLQAYEYLCHVAEAKEWIENILNEELDETANFEESLRNGIILARIAKHFEPSVVKKIFEGPVLQFRHSDNIAYFISCMKKVGLPELVDLYEKKNLPRVIYCIHALSHLLAKGGRANNINNLVGQLDFSDDVLQRKQDQIDEAGIVLPAFKDLGSTLEKHLSVEQKYMSILKGDLTKVLKIQQAFRMYSAKKKLSQMKHEKSRNDDFASKIQALVRGMLVRNHLRDIKSSLNVEYIISFQAAARGFLLRKCLGRKKQLWNDNMNNVILLQASIRGFLARKRFFTQRNFYRENIDKIVKIQAAYRGYVVCKAYQALAKMKETPLASLQMFSHLLDEDGNDIEEEMELDELRAQIVKKIKENQEREASLSELDIKIALLVKNSITLDEVIRQTRKVKENRPSSFNKEETNKLQLFGNLFYLLQTQPQYLTKLMFLAGPNKIKSLSENVIFGLFAYGQNAREECLILKLIESTMNSEINTIVDDISILMRENLLFIKLIIQFNRGAKEREYLRDLLGPLVLQIINEKDCDLETDPLIIYKAMIKEEESLTGEKSQLPYDIPRDQSLENPKVREKYIAHLKNVQSVVTQFMTAIISSLKKMPFGIRYIAKVYRKALKSKFPNESESVIIKAIGNLIYYRYINPAIVAPEAFDVLETVIPAKERKNLAEISKILQHISMNKPFGDDSTYLIPLNDFVSSAHNAFQKYFLEVTNVVDADEHFQVDAFKDLVRTQKPSIYISPADIYNTHSLLVKFVNDLTEGPQDPLRIILNEIGTVSDVMSQDKVELALKLENKFSSDVIKDSDINSLLLATKTMILPIVRIQKGKNLLELLESPSTEKEDQLFREYQLRPRSLHSRVNVQGSAQVLGSIADMSTMSFSKLKERTLENLEKLEAFKVVSKDNYYQEILNIISKDIKSKRLRQSIRTKDLNTNKKTLVNLEAKAKYLKDQIDSYHDYLNASVEQLSKNKSKKKSGALPFTKQYSHMKELQKSGKVPQFGSYKYSAEALYKKGVLISIDDYSPKQYDKISLTISSDEPGIFTIEASLLGIKVPQKMELKLEDLLQSQFDNVQVFNLFGIAKINVNLMIYLINKKFYQ